MFCYAVFEFIVFVMAVVFDLVFLVFFFQAEDGIRDLVRSRGLGDVYKRQAMVGANRARLTVWWVQPLL